MNKSNTKFHWISNLIGIQWNPSGRARNVSLKFQSLVHFHAPSFTNPVYFPPMTGHPFSKATSCVACLEEFHCIVSGQAPVCRLLNQPFINFRRFTVSMGPSLPVPNHIHIRQVSPQPSCSNICQIQMWFNESNTSCKSRTIPYTEIKT